MALIKVKSRGTDNVIGRRNLVINGAMQIWQRGTTSSALTHNGGVYHTADRWGAVLDQDQGSGTLTTTFSQSTDVPSTETFPYSLKAVVASSSRTPSGTDCTALFYQHIETYNANPLGWGTAAAKPATLSYWIKSSVAGTGTLQLRLNDSNQVNGVADAQFYTKFTINQANTWEKKTHLIPANATDGWRRDVSASAIQVYWFFGSNQAAAPTQDAWFRQNNYGQKHDDATFNFQVTGGTAYITGVQFEVGSSATDFEHRSFGEELSLCQRYFYIFPRTGGTLRWNVTYYSGSAYATDNLPSMRVLPTVTDIATGTSTASGFNVYALDGDSMNSSTNEGNAPTLGSQGLPENPVITAQWTGVSKPTGTANHPGGASYNGALPGIHCSSEL